MSEINDNSELTVEFLPEGIVITAIEGETIMQAARRAGVMIDAPCGEHGRCGKCRVTVIEGETDEPSVTELEKLTPADLAAGTRLSCLAKLQSSIVVEVPNTSRHDTRRKATTALPYHITPDSYTKKVLVNLSSSAIGGDLRSDLTRLRDTVTNLNEVDLAAVQCFYNVVTAGNSIVTAIIAGDRLIGVESGDTTAIHFGAAIDVGTTTVAGYLVNLITGREVAAASIPNPQSAFGADVISRIEYSGTQCDKVEQLREVVSSAINEMLYTMAETAGISICDIYEITMVGNTCMTHLFLGVDPHSLGQSPYVPIFTESIKVSAEELGLCIQPRGVVRTLPNIAGFVGADAVGVLAASNIKSRPGLQVAVDIGTNAEVVASFNGRVVACSAAAGPAFEGARISCGMRAQPGAIDRIKIDDEDLKISTIGDEKAYGLCGSGVIEAVGELRRVGIIESTGAFADPDDLPNISDKLRNRITDDGIILAYANDSGIDQDIILTMRDVREVQLVKAAIYAGISMLLETMGYTPADITNLHIAGAFGTYINPEHALNIGLIPNIPLDKVHFLGNAAGAGAKMALMNRGEFDKIVSSAINVEYIELAGDTSFSDHFMMAMLLAPGCEDDD